MAPKDVTLLEVGRPEWRRWLIFHRERNRYWRSGVWKRRRRDGDLWYSKAEAEQELRMVRLGS